MLSIFYVDVVDVPAAGCAYFRGALLCGLRGDI